MAFATAVTAMNIAQRDSKSSKGANTLIEFNKNAHRLKFKLCHARLKSSP
jgi:hypothetical protein